MADQHPELPASSSGRWSRLVNAGKTKAEVMREYDLSKSTVDRWVKAINLSGSPHAADNPHARAEQDHRAGAREQAAPHGGRRF